MEKYVKLKPKKAVFVRRQHPWVFSGAIGEQADGLEDGDRVSVLDPEGNCLATGHYQEGSIRVRLLHRGQRLHLPIFGRRLWQELTQVDK